MAWHVSAGVVYINIIISVNDATHTTQSISEYTYYIYGISVAS